MLLTENNAYGLPFTLQMYRQRAIPRIRNAFIIITWDPITSIHVLLMSCNTCDCPTGVLQYVWLFY